MDRNCRSGTRRSPSSHSGGCSYPTCRYCRNLHLSYRSEQRGYPSPRSRKFFTRALWTPADYLVGPIPRCRLPRALDERRRSIVHWSIDRLCHVDPSRLPKIARRSRKDWQEPVRLAWREARQDASGKGIRDCQYVLCHHPGLRANGVSAIDKGHALLSRLGKRFQICTIASADNYSTVHTKRLQMEPADRQETDRRLPTPR